jgi:hypothetical protein
MLKAINGWRAPMIVAPAGGQAGRAKIGRALGAGEQSLASRLHTRPAAHLPGSCVRGAGGFFIQVDRHFQRSNPFAQPAGHFHAFLHGDVADRHKRHHIGGAQAGMLAGVLVQVDQAAAVRMA